jgi:hypothetical protein
MTSMMRAAVVVVEMSTNMGVSETRDEQAWGTWLDGFFVFAVAFKGLYGRGPLESRMASLRCYMAFISVQQRTANA